MVLIPYHEFVHHFLKITYHGLRLPSLQSSVTRVNYSLSVIEGYRFNNARVQLYTSDRSK